MARFGEAKITVENVTYTLTLDAKVEDKRILISWALVSTPETQEGTVEFDFGTPSMNAFTIHLPPNTGPLALCLAGCIGKSFIEPIIECFLKNKNAKDILACLRGKGIQITGHALACGLECLMKHPV